MLTTSRRSGYRSLVLLALLLSACAARQELHEFPPELALPARPAAEVNYSLRADGAVPGRWELFGGQGASIGVFQWQAGAGDAGGADMAGRRVDVQREIRVTDGVNGKVYALRIGVVQSRLGQSSVIGMAPPRALVFEGATGARIGDLELRSGFEQRLEGVWRDQPLLWQVEFLPERRVSRDTQEGSVEAVYPAAQRIRWAGGSDAGLTVYAGREVSGSGERFGEPFFDIAADRPLTRQELGDMVVMLFALRALQQNP